MCSWFCYWILGGLVLYLLFRWAFWLKVPIQRRRTQDGHVHQLGLVVISRDREPVIEGVIRHLLGLIRELAESQMELTLVVVDDRSQDNSALIIERLLRCHHHIRFAHLEPGTTISESPVEVGLSLCSTPVALVLDLRGETDVLGALDDLSHALGGGTPHSQ